MLGSPLRAHTDRYAQRLAQPLGQAAHLIVGRLLHQMERQLGQFPQQITGMLDRTQMPDATELIDQAVTLALQIDIEDVDAALEEISSRASM